MRNALVVLVPVCIGLTSGFIVPSSIQEILNTSQKNENIESLNGILTEITLQRDVHLKTTTAIMKMNNIDTTERSSNQILDKALFEYIIQKNVNLSERSFIYIKNQKNKHLKEHFNDKNVRKFSLLNVKNIFEDVHRRRKDKKFFNIQSLLEDFGHRCKAKSSNIEKYNNYVETKDQDKLFKFFGIPIFLNDLEKYKGDTDNKVRSKSYSDYLIPTNSKGYMFYRKSKQKTEKPKKSSIDKTSLHEFEAPSESESDGNEILDYLINKDLEDQWPKEKNYILHNGFHYCRD